MRIALAIAVATAVGVPHAHGEATAPDAVAPPKTIYVQVYAAKGLSEQHRLALEEALADGAGEVDELSKSKITRADPEEEARQKAIDKALDRSDKALAEAKKRVKNLEDGALDLLDWAADEYARYLPQLMARDGNAGRLLDVYIQLTIVLYVNQEMDEAAKTIKHAFVLEPELDYDPKRFPPQLEDFVVQERLLFDELGHGTLKASVKGAGSVRVYVNGIDKGEAPVTIRDMRAGPNFVLFTAPGAEPVAEIGMIDGGHTTIVEVTLPAGNSVVVGVLAKTRGDVGSERASKRLRKAADKLGASGMLLVLPKLKGNKLQLVAYVYDMRSGELVNHVELMTTLEDADTDADELAQSALRGVEWKLMSIVVVQRDPAWRRYWNGAYESKYFWPAVGATAGVILLGVVVSASGGLSTGKKVTLFSVIRF